MMKRLHEKASITVFLSLLLVLFIGFIMMITEHARIFGLHQRLVCATDSAMDSLFSMYDRELLNEFDLMLLNENELSNNQDPDFPPSERRTVFWSCGTDRSSSRVLTSSCWSRRDFTISCTTASLSRRLQNNRRKPKKRNESGDSFLFCVSGLASVFGDDDLNLADVGLTDDIEGVHHAAAHLHGEGEQRVQLTVAG